VTGILLADDHAVVRRGLRALLEAEADFRVVGETGDGLEAVRAVERLQPDVLVVDLMMPGLGGLEVARQASRVAPRTRIVVLSMHAAEGYVLEALRSGVTGYVLKDASPSELVQAVREVVAGRHFLSPALSRRAIDEYVAKAKAAPPDAYQALTTREREVLHLVAEGRTSAEIARRLGISARTAETHRGNLMRKLGLQSAAELTRYALERGLISADAFRPRDPGRPGTS
jgi:DNA-binding NarL/FixJ family response regulator